MNLNPSSAYMEYSTRSLLKSSVRVILFTILWWVGPKASGQTVDLLTGQAQASVPIWDLTYGDISVPISLYHHGNAVRVEEGEGAFGVGWNLVAGGAVSRVVRGLPDDYSVSTDGRKGWLFRNQAYFINTFIPSSNDALATCSDESTDYDSINAQGYWRDTEPDMFYFNAPGLSGQFVFGADGTPKLLTYQDLLFTVNKDAGGRIVSFSIVNDKGITYLFSTVESVKRKVGRPYSTAVSAFQSDYNYYKVEAAYTGAWLLTSITSAATGRTASFSYNDLDETQSNRYVTLIGATTNQPDTLYFLTDRYSPRQLSTITAGGYAVNISWFNGLVRKISVTSTAGIESKDFEFFYEEITSSTDTGNPKVYRSFLSEIKQTQNCQPFPSYAFVYEGVTFGTSANFPFENRKKQDFWGFYNGGSTNKNVPTIYYYANQKNDRRFRASPISDQTITTTLSGDSRAVNTATVGFGALKEINYPRGGTVKYTYEANQYYDASDMTTQTGPGVRVKSVSSYGGEVAYGKNSTDIDTAHSIQRNYEYKGLTGATSGLLTYPLAYAFATSTALLRTLDQLGESPQLMYSRVKEITPGRGSQVYEFELPHMYPDTIAGTRSKIARQGPTCSVGNLKNGVYTFPFAPNPNYERGLLKKQTVYSQSGTMVSQRRIYYVTQSITPDTVRGLKFERIDDGFHFSKYFISTGARKVVSQEFNVQVGEQSPGDSTKITVSYTYSSHKRIQKITTTSDDGSITEENFKYVKDFESITGQTGTDIPATAIKALLAARRHGEIIERYQTLQPIGSSTSKTIGASLVLYKTYSSPALTLPYKYLSWPQLSSGFTAATSTSTSFSYNTHYVVSRTIDEYDAKGNVVGETDNHKNQIGYWTWPDYTLPPGAVISQAKRSQAVYEGFEWASGPGFSFQGGNATFGTPYAGAQSIQLTSGGTYLKSGNVEKSGNSYRVSCWVNAAQSTTITFRAKDGATLVSGSSTNMDYNNAALYNKWVYLDTVMNVTSAPATFQVEVLSNATALVDEVIATPVAARIALSSTRPLLGITSQTDDRGNSVSYTFDPMGRKVKTFDRKQNLVEQKDYVYARAINKKPTAAFSSSTTTSYMTGQSITFTSMVNSCIDLTYSWEIYKTGGTPVATSSNPTISYTFTTAGEYNVKLSVNSTQYGSSAFIQNICVSLTPPSYTLNCSQSLNVYKCNDLTRTFSVQNPPSGNVGYQWQVKIGSSSEWSVLDPLVYNQSSINYSSPLQTYYVRCEISQYNPGIPENPSCGSAMVFGVLTNPLTLTFVDNSPCP